MKKYVLDIAEVSKPSLHGGDQTFIFETLQQLKRFLIGFVTNNDNRYIAIHKVDFYYDSYIEGNPEEIEFKVKTNIGDLYELQYGSDGAPITTYTNLTKSQVRYRLKFMYPIENADSGSSVGKIFLSKITYWIDTTGALGYTKVVLTDTQWEKFL